MKAETILDESMEMLVTEYKELQGDAVTLEQELNREGEDGEDRTWYQNFGGKVLDLKQDFIVKVQNVKVHLTSIEDATKTEGLLDMKEGTMGSRPKNFKGLDAVKKQNYHLNTLSVIARKVQKLVKDHGTALEFLRELFMKQDEKITKLKEKHEEKIAHLDQKMKDIPTATWMENEINSQLEVKQAEFTNTQKDVKDDLDRVKRENADIKSKEEELKEEISETRQRGMKGNLIISCPETRQGGPSKAVQRLVVDGSRNEWPQEMCSRLIREKTGVHIPPSDMTACHRLGYSVKKKNSWIVRVENRAPNSGWETLTAGMFSGKKPDGHWFNQNDGIYINYMLEPTKNDLLWQVRMLRKRQLVQKYSVNQNGRITILKDKSPRSQPGQQLAKEPWIEIKNIKKLRGVFPAVSFPIEKEGQQEATN